MYHAQELIEKAFEEHDIKFLNEHDGHIMAGFTVENGPRVRVLFINQDNDNDVAIRLFGLVSVKPEKYAQVYRALNKLCMQFRYLKFYMDDDGDVNVEYDLPINIGDESVGEACFETFVRIMRIVNEAFPMLMEAIYSPSVE